MALKSQLIKLIGHKILDGSSIFNLTVKQILKTLGILPDSTFYEFIRRLYRLNSRVAVTEKSYSTFGEDRILVCYLPELDGNYVDVGSGSPRNGSNTYLFYRRGWTGITIDPLAEVVKLHRKKRPRDRQINACVSDTEQEQIEFHEYTSDDFSTDSPERMKFLSELGINPISSFDVKTIKLSNELGYATPDAPTLLDIDVEGNELSVLKSNNWGMYLPRVICIEEWQSPIYINTLVREFLEDQGYKLVSRAFLSSIYVHSTYLATKAEMKLLNKQWFSP